MSAHERISEALRWFRTNEFPDAKLAMHIRINLRLIEGRVDDEEAGPYVLHLVAASLALADSLGYDTNTILRMWNENGNN